jgi:chemotaxis protein methyltransferase CheR
MNDVDVEAIELDLLVEAIWRRYGYDFRGYAKASLARRVHRRLVLDGIETMAALQHALLHDVSYFRRLMKDLTVTTTEMFRHAPFFSALREIVAPRLKTYPYVHIWHAGVSTGQEVYSMAILLREAGLYDRCRLYATDVNRAALDAARAGVFPASKLKQYTEAYQLAGGREPFADYFTVAYDKAAVDESLKENIVFAEHNLATDAPFGEMHLVLCRNVLIYFDRDLRERALGVLHESTVLNGMLAVGSRESLRFSKLEDLYDEVDRDARLYRKVRQ